MRVAGIAVVTCQLGLIAGLMVGLTGSAGTAAYACSLTSLPPTNFALVRDAELIVVAHADSVKGDVASFSIKSIVKTGKGNANAAKAGDKLALRTFGKYDGPSKNIHSVRPGALHGMCEAMDYKTDDDYVLFLRSDKDGLHLASTPMSRINEEADPVWLDAIAAYVAVAATPRSKHVAGLNALVKAGKVVKATVGAIAIADDAQRALHRLTAKGKDTDSE